MDWLWILLILITVIGGLSVLLFVFQLRKEDGEERFESSRENLQKMSEEMELLKFLANKNDKTLEKLELVQDKLQFATPSNSKESEKWENRIKNQLGDLKLALARGRDKGTYAAANRILTELELLIYERENIVKE